MEINPNWHVILIHYPLGLLVAGLLIELFSFLGWRHSSFRSAGRWMILLGSLSMIPAALSGMYAIHDLVRSGEPPSNAWHEAVADMPLAAAQFDALVFHGWLLGGATALSVIASIVWLGASDRIRKQFHIVLLIALLLGVGLMVRGAWYGGEAIYQHWDSSKLATPPAEAPDTEAPMSEKIAHFIPPLQSHVLLSGIMIAIGMAAIGCSARRINQVADAVDSEDAMDTPGRTAEDAYADAMIRSLNPNAAVADDPNLPVTGIPSARFWLLSMILGLFTAVTGIWFMGNEFGSFDAKELFNNIVDPEATRRLAHVILGVSMVLLSMILAVSARWAPMKKSLLMFLSFLFLLAIAGQLWMGSLLLFDSPVGKVTGFNSSDSVEASESQSTQPAPAP